MCLPLSTYCACVVTHCFECPPLQITPVIWWVSPVCPHLWCETLEFETQVVWQMMTVYALCVSLSTIHWHKYKYWQIYTTTNSRMQKLTNKQKLFHEYKSWQINKYSNTSVCESNRWWQSTATPTMPCTAINNAFGEISAKDISQYDARDVKFHAIFKVLHALNMYTF